MLLLAPRTSPIPLGCSRMARTGFSVVEAIVSLALVGVAGALLAASFTVTTAARRSATLDARSADALRERVALLSRRPCDAADTAAVDRFGAATDSWSARRAHVGWTFSDSLALPGVPSRAPFTGAVRCP